MAAFADSTPRSVGLSSLSEPPKVPKGVRFADKNQISSVFEIGLMMFLLNGCQKPPQQGCRGSLRSIPTPADSLTAPQHVQGPPARLPPQRLSLPAYIRPPP